MYNIYPSQNNCTGYLCPTYGKKMLSATGPDRPTARTDPPPKITNHSVCLRVAKICLTFFDKFGSFWLIRSQAGRTTFKIKKSYCDSKTFGPPKNLTVTIRLLATLHHFVSFA